MSSIARHFARNCVLVLIALQAWSAAQNPAQNPVNDAPPDPHALFQQGEAALRAGSLDQAEQAFRGVLALDPSAVGAYANLGVIAMRRKEWKPALAMLHRAEALAPQIAGLRLDIGLVYYRQGDFQSAIAPFDSVLRDSPESSQARYLLGLCEFFTERYADAANTLEPLWPQQSGNLSFLYVLGIAANKANRPDLENRALGRLVEIGQNSAEFHLLMGKALLNRTEYEKAIAELKQAAAADSKLPYVHFDLGLAYLKIQDFPRARAEFLADLALEPDLADNYTQLGIVAASDQKDDEAEKNFRKALELNPQDANARYQLAKVFQRKQKYAEALQELDAALKLAPQNQSIHYVRGQILQRLERADESKKEMEIAGQLSEEGRAKRQKELEEGPARNPEVMQEPQ